VGPFDRLPTLALALAATVASIGGCGDDDAPSGRTATAAVGEPVAVVATEYAFDPATLVLEGGGELEVELENRGSLAHNLRVLQGAEELGGTATFPGGESRSATVEVEPGTYRLVCTVGNHEELGMVGELQVR
jgi:plastocyanin